MSRMVGRGEPGAMEKTGILRITCGGVWNLFGAGRNYEGDP